VTKVESVVEPDGVTDDIGRKSKAFIGVHSPILSEIGQLTWRI
jgi:hypothetical protein